MFNAFNAKKKMGDATFYSLTSLEERGLGSVSTMPYTLKVILESLLRGFDGGKSVSEDDIAALAGWTPENHTEGEIAYRPARVLLQDFTGVPAVVDLAAMREAVARLGGDPKKINPLIPADLVIDHSLQVDHFGDKNSLDFNVGREYERNLERYEFLKWGQSAFDNFRVVPPSTGIIHQVNLEYLADVVAARETGEGVVLLPDTLVGTDSHTTMINGLGVLGWGVGGIEAEAAMLGQPLYMLVPKVVGVKLTGALSAGVTATDLVLALTELLRKHGVVGKLVEYYGPGLDNLTLPDRAVIANMAPEYGATAGFFPVDDVTIDFLRFTGREKAKVDIAELYLKEQTLFRAGNDESIRFNETLELDISTVVPAVAGPKRPQDRISLPELKGAFAKDLSNVYGKDEAKVVVGEGERASTYDDAAANLTMGDAETKITHGDVAIAAITSCTNTSSPALMVGAGLLAKRAVERGITVRPWVKTSLTPGSRVVTAYLEESGLMPYLEALRFHVAGYGCATCIGNSGELPAPVAEAIKKNDLVVAGVVSGNRNFEGRINPLVKANYLASPPLVVAYALAGTVDIDFEREPLAFDSNGEPVYLAELWPTSEEINAVISGSLTAEMFDSKYSDVFAGDEKWRSVKTVGGELYEWDEASTYIRNPPFFTELKREAAAPAPIEGARVLALLGDSVTTDHISPAGAIAKDGPAAKYLAGNGVEPGEFNSFGSRRGNHEVMMRGTFANVRLRNLLAPGTEGGVTIHLPSGETTSIYDAAMRYAADNTPLVVLAGKDYGMGSSRDWAAKGTTLLGVRAVIAESYERIHRSNLVGMGVLPLEFPEGENASSLGLTGKEEITIEGLEGISAGCKVKVIAGDKSFDAKVRIDTPVEVDYFNNGGILQTVIRSLI
ncbi:MAG: aconitate hydratase AcnA [Deltaproteobacteria bacterium]|nr:MAG: aconitate hydratase AcnA [Deltaproteobacteria bacterium]